MDNKKINLYVELALFLILGFLVGAVVKTESAKRLTMGFSDYQAPTLKQGYDFVQIQKDLEASQNSGNDASTSDTQQSGGSCSNQ
jgi:hypothetical protein